MKFRRPNEQIKDTKSYTFQEEQGDTHWMLQCIMSSVERAAKCGPLFEFTPEFYIDAAINAFHGLRLYFHPTANFTLLPGTLDYKPYANMAAAN